MDIIKLAVLIITAAIDIFLFKEIKNGIAEYGSDPIPRDRIRGFKFEFLCFSLSTGLLLWVIISAIFTAS